ncbi:sulfhydryl oxidase 1-like [Bombus vosnesenskii]|uniref:Sulfhydryl oxidase n=1 Tax=Bombus vosnesenskii TaxID=207650 RepID=A0A6J3JZ28_9HYME|nr:sulfhydryl oxidase 1-like [Bombus vosnesenskii]XP_050469911.1 sulfhydryl oxidase 1-like [Bombus huntii]
MDRFDVSLLWKLWLISIIIVNCNAAVAKEPYQSQIPTQGLYNTSDNVVILNVTNFKSSVYEDTKGWLVEFYNSWCGYCLRFAPLWKDFANDIYAWKDIVVIAAIDCADDDNNPICREYEIMHYPMLKYFSVNAHPPSLGLLMEKYDDINELRHSLIDLLGREQQEGRGISWPNIAPYRNYETTNIWKAIPNAIKYVFLLFERTDSHLGAEVILDMHKITTLQIRRVLSDNELLCETNKVTNFPSLIVLARNETQKVLKIRIPTREGVFNAIKEFMISKAETIHELNPIKNHSIKNENHKLNASTPKQLQATPQPESTDISGDHLYQLDLENALRYSISHEIPLHKIIKDKKMDALKRYLNVLADYFPLRYGNIFLEITRDIIKKRNNISGEEFSQIVKSIEEEMSPVYSGPSKWVGCKGSKEGYRGYPCGLWTMFHMLTVNFAILNKDVEREPRKILEAMHGYIQNFFGCADCAQHFVQMASKNKMFDVSNANDSILWLWSAHNEVNARLSGDDTEDPKHKKIQYPAVEHCPNCRYENGTWNEEHVLYYLKTKYSYKGINYYDSVNTHKDSNDNKLKIRQERLVLSKYTNNKKIGWDFTIFDISICVVLYVASAIILILVCIKFAVKRTYRKRHYVSLLAKCDFYFC